MILFCLYVFVRNCGFSDLSASKSKTRRSFFCNEWSKVSKAAEA